MMLKELIEYLEKEDPNVIVPMGFNEPHSYRGYYHDLAFEPIENITVGDMLKFAKEVLGTIQIGYKGGEYKMHDYVDVYLAEFGCTGEGIGEILLNYMLGKYNKR